MDLCSRNYGFFYVPGLMVFLNPWSPFRAVTESYLGESDQNPKEFRALHGKDATLDLMSRVSTTFHERKHFHDVLFTPYGHHLFRQAFMASLAGMALFQEKSWRKPSVYIPLNLEDLNDSEVLRRARQQISKFQQTLASARYLLEASATLCQLQALWTHHGAEDKDSIEAHIAEAPEYSELLDRLECLGKELFTHGDIFPQLVHRLILLGLSSSEPLFGCETHDEGFEHLLGLVESSNPYGLKNRLQNCVEKAWQGIKADIAMSQKKDHETLRIIENWAKPNDYVTMCVLEAFRDFVDQSHAFQKLALEDSNAYLDLAAYCEPYNDRIQPLCYYYSCDDSLSLRKEPLDLSRDPELISQKVFKNPHESRELYSYRLFPVPLMDETRTFSRETWVEFVKGATSNIWLVEEVDWLHPLAEYYFKTTGKFLGLNFRRRMRT